MNINLLMQQAQKMQKEMTKAMKALEETLFTFTSNGGAITLHIYGNRKVDRIEIDEDAIDKDEKDMLEDMIKIAINEAIDKIDEENQKIQAKFSSQMRLPF